MVLCNNTPPRSTLCSFLIPRSFTTVCTARFAFFSPCNDCCSFVGSFPSPFVRVRVGGSPWVPFFQSSSSLLSSLKSLSGCTCKLKSLSQSLSHSPLFKGARKESSSRRFCGWLSSLAIIQNKNRLFLKNKLTNCKNARKNQRTLQWLKAKLEMEGGKE